MSEFAKGEPVFVAEVGTGPRPGVVLSVYSTGIACRFGEERVIVRFTDRPDDLPRDCYASSVFTSETECQQSLN